MRPRPPPTHHRRRGMMLLATAASLGAVVMLLGLAQSQLGQLSWRWTRRTRRDLETEDLVRSAMAEATAVAMARVNDPADPLYGALRLGADTELVAPLPLPATAAAFADDPWVAQVAAKLAVPPRRAAGTRQDPAAQWDGLARIQVTATLRDPGAPPVVALEERQLLARSISPPFPLDHHEVYDWRLDPFDPHTGPFEMSREEWRARATLRVDADDAGEVQAAFESLRENLGAVNGVVYVDNQAGHPLVLRDLRHRGKAILVVRGPLEVEEVRLEDPQADRLTLLAFGDVSLRGEVEADVVFTHSPGDPVGRRVVHPGTVPIGTFALTWGSYQADEDVALSPRIRPSTDDAGRLDPGHVFLSLSPVLERSMVVKS